MTKRMIIRPKKRVFDPQDLVELFRFKDLFFVLTGRDIKIKYKQTVLGIGWVIFQPLISTIVFTLLFSHSSAFNTNGLPYPIFAFLGLIFWTFFSNSLNTISSSLQNSEGIIKKVYFPRIVVPLSSLVANMLDFWVGSSIFFLSLLVFKTYPSGLFVLSYLLGFIVVSVTVFSMGLFLCAINVKYRDVRFILPFFIQVLIFLTPVFYPLSIVNPANRWILALNPLTTVIETNRAILSHSAVGSPLQWTISIIAMIVAGGVGYYYFKRTEDYLSDIL